MRFPNILRVGEVWGKWGKCGGSGEAMWGSVGEVVKRCGEGGGEVVSPDWIFWGWRELFHWFSTGHKKTPQFFGGVRASVCGSFYTFALCQENKAKLGIF